MDHLYMGERKDGVYVIYPKDGPEITVFCDLTTNGGGWTVIQRRHEMKIPFARNWEQYRDGFGPVDGEFWLGNENIQRLGKGQLLTRLTAGRNYSTYSLYNQFNVNPSFSLIAQDHSGLISDGIFKMSRHEENPFFSYDNVSRTGVNCVKKSDGGWWFGGDCDTINLNGEAGNKCDAPFLSSEIMMRPRAPCKYFPVQC